MTNTVDPIILSKILVDLSTAIYNINAVPSENSTVVVDTTNLVETFNNTLNALSSNLSAINSVKNTQLEITHPATKNTETAKDAPKEQPSSKKTKETNSKKEEVVTNKKKESLSIIKPEKKEVEKTETKEVDSLEVQQASDIVIKEATLLLQKNVGKEITNSTKLSIVALIKNTYSKVLPEHNLATNETEIEEYYTNILMPQIKADLKAAAVDTQQKSTKVPETPVDTKKEEKVSENKLSEVDDILAGLTKGEEIIKENSANKTEEPVKTNNTVNSEESTEEEVITNLPNIDNFAKEIVEILKEEPEAALGTISPKLKETCKIIFTDTYKSNPKLKLPLNDKQYLFTDYADLLVKKVKALTGAAEKSHLVRVGNKPQIRLIKTWAPEWAKAM